MWTLLRSDTAAQPSRGATLTLLLLTFTASAAAHAQAPGGRLQFVVPPSTWRLTVTGEVMPAADVRERANPLAAPSDAAVTRGTIRLSAPVIKRGLYTTVVTNDLVYDRFGVDYGSTAPQAPSIVALPGSLHAVSQELGVSHAVNTRWRLTGALQHGFFSTGGTRVRGDSYRAAGAAFVSRVYRPTLQVGAGVVALNVSPYVIPTVRILHVGRKWRTDVLLPRAETFRDVGHGVELGGVLRFVGNRWQGDERPAAQQLAHTRATYQQAMLGPALTWRAGAHGLLQVEGGLALRRLQVDFEDRNGARVRQNLDTEIGPLLRLSGRLTF